MDYLIWKTISSHLNWMLIWKSLCTYVNIWRKKDNNENNIKRTGHNEYHPKLTQKNPQRPFSPSSEQHKRIRRLLASSLPAAAVQGLSPTGGSISSSRPTAVPTKAQGLNTKTTIISVVCQNMNSLLPQFKVVSSLIAFSIPCLQINTISKLVI